MYIYIYHTSYIVCLYNIYTYYYYRIYLFINLFTVRNHWTTSVHSAAFAEEPWATEVEMALVAIFEPKPSTVCELEITVFGYIIMDNILLVLSREWMGMGVAGMIITSEPVDHSRKFPT